MPSRRHRHLVAVAFAAVTTLTHARRGPLTSGATSPHRARVTVATQPPSSLSDTQIDSLTQITIHAYYVGENEAGMAACERLLNSSRVLPDATERTARTNRPWYTQSLSDFADSTRILPLDVPPARTNWTLFNPSVIATRSGYAVLIRSSNYDMHPITQRYHIPPADDGVIKTEYVWVHLTPDLKVAAPPVTIPMPTYPTTDYPVHGMEDARVNAVYGRLYVSGNIRNHAGFDGVPRMAVAEFDGRRMGVPVMLDTKTGTTEKNWMPLMGRFGKWLYAVHGGDDGTLATVQVDTGQAGPAITPFLNTTLRVTPTHRTPPITRQYRGGSGLVQLTDGRWLGVVHETAVGSYGRAYEHRFIVLNRGANRLIGQSLPFYFDVPRAIEYCAGLAVKGQHVVMTYGAVDRTAWVASVQLGQVLAMVRPV